MSVFGTESNAHGGTRTSSPATTGTFVTSVGDLIIVGVGWSDSGTASVSDVAGNTYIPLTQRVGAFSTFFQYFYCFATAASAVNAVSAAFSNPTNNNTVVFVRDIPLSGGAAYDFDSASDGGNDATTGSWSSTGSDEYVGVQAYDQFGTDSYAPGSGYSLDSAGFDPASPFGGAEHQLFSSPQSSVTANFSSHPGGSAAFAIGFKATGGGGGGGGGSAQPVVCVMQ